MRAVYPVGHAERGVRGHSHRRWGPEWSTSRRRAPIRERSQPPCCRRSASITASWATLKRRQYFGETDETVNLKLKKLFDTTDIIPILCVGENLEQREAGAAQLVVGGQLSAGLEGISAENAAKLVIAYEPVWAIGTGKTATPEQAEEMCAFIRGVLEGLYDEDVCDQVIIQYGGSVKPENATEIMNMDEIDGRSGRRSQSGRRKIHGDYQLLEIKYLIFTISYDTVKWLKLKRSA